MKGVGNSLFLTSVASVDLLAETVPPGRNPALEAGLRLSQAKSKVRGSQDSNLESPVLETGALASWATAPEGAGIVTSGAPLGNGDAGGGI